MKTPETYDRTRHAAAHTSAYLFHQLIPYLGNKRKLLPLIAEAVRSTGVKSGTFVDFFGGSGVVSRWAKQSGFRTVCNDWEPFARCVNSSYIGMNELPADAPSFDFLNALPPINDGYLASNYCPFDDSLPQPDIERCFFTRANGGKIEAIRVWLEENYQSGQLSLAAVDYVMAPLLYASCYVSNTSGVFKAYHHGWGGSNGTALYRILSDLTVREPVLFDNGLRNVVTQMDAQSLADNWSAIAPEKIDIAYLDPPYNQHPYGSNYHLLNTIALWDKPAIGPVERGSKSAIRKDWRSERNSAFCSKSDSLNGLQKLVDAIDCRWIVMSYSTDGNMGTQALLDSLGERGTVRAFSQSYKRYRVSAPRMSPKSHNVEVVLVLEKGKPMTEEATSAALMTMER